MDQQSRQEQKNEPGPFFMSSQKIMDRNNIVRKLEKDLQHKGYVTRFFQQYGLPRLYVGRGTLGPEMSWVSYLLTKYLLSNPKLYRSKRVDRKSVV